MSKVQQIFARKALDSGEPAAGARPHSCQTSTSPCDWSAYPSTRCPRHPVLGGNHLADQAGFQNIRLHKISIPCLRCAAPYGLTKRSSPK